MTLPEVRRTWFGLEIPGPATAPASPWAMLAIFVGSLLLRLVYVRQIASNPYFDSPTMDPLFHDQWARAIASGKPWLEHEPYFRAPLYPYFLAFVYRFLSPGYLLSRVIQAVIGSMTPVLVYLVARRTFGERAARLAGAVAAAYWMLIYFDAELLINVFENFFNLLFLWLTMRAFEKDRPGRWALAGAALGLSAIARPTILAVGVALLVWLAAARARGFARNSAAFLAGTALMILPVSARNLIVAHDPVPIAWQGGINFYLGNHAGADGWSATAPGFPLDWWGGYNHMNEVAEKAAGHALKRSQVSDYWVRQGLAFVRTDPGGFVRLTLRKLALFWSGTEFGNNQDVYFFRRYAPLLRWPLPRFSLVAPLALAGMLLFTRGARAALLALFTGVYMATIAAFFVCDKLRLPVVPVLIVFASAFAVSGFDAIRARQYRPLVLGLVLIAPFAALVNVNFLGITGPSFSQSYASVGSVYLSKGRYEDAERAYRACIALNDAFPSVHMNLGAVLLRQGHPEEAIAEYRKEVATGRPDPSVFANLAFLLQQRGDTEEAIELYRRSIAAGVKGADVLYNLGSSLARAAKPAEAEDCFRQALQLQPENLQALNNLAVVVAQQGRLDEAIAIWERIVAREPAFPQVQENIDEARESLGRSPAPARNAGDHGAGDDGGHRPSGARPAERAIGG